MADGPTFALGSQVVAEVEPDAVATEYDPAELEDRLVVAEVCLPSTEFEHGYQWVRIVYDCIQGGFYDVAHICCLMLMYATSS